MYNRHDALESNAFVLWGLTAAAIGLPCYMIYQSQQKVAKGSDNDSASASTEQTARSVMPAQANDKWKGGPVARVKKLLVHPIKSCGGMSLTECRYTPEGLAYDRTWCIVDATTHAVITGRTVPKMVLITPRVEEDSGPPHGGALRISLKSASEELTFSTPLNPDAETLEQWKRLGDVGLWGNTSLEGYVCEFLDRPVSNEAGTTSPSEILSNFLGVSVLLVRKGPKPRWCKPTPDFPDLSGAAIKFQDGYPVLLLSHENLDAITSVVRDHVGRLGVDGRWEKENLEIERFRPNVVIEGAGAFAEDEWQSVVIHSSDVPAAEGTSFNLVSKCTRCLFPNVDISTGVPDKAVPYKMLMKFRAGLVPQEKYKPCVGCNTIPQGSGVLHVGDVLTVAKTW